ncbi:histidine phosphatase family protein [Pseudosulfitobacter pseudonitzschiae]|uniref:histidine phosphatase family protein n=1 Tax=Pseudosulfitobacter pseudonitzschiae TaxID=1402135 RepID=UPI001AF1AFD6|nr:histidine phosphatase family protein [Pseudosulfitobacter pseudonitzschiae]MBM1816188.1 histidine phosphatase family protein [Pseudosulfitobacter pseudonitzschiae]MBM1833679.1 histidine phosphatase family protein [Pseudosulfitobacter pseudonitzschiae]MBM1838545.1 histidine phosphatase family protein [Pseudosulfitobacter pseudonitzschiae]MBM1842893.1 histidine phosphatase family protein [Pseudosulfitobacter pseudonitzschiae]MBM1847759.1 histidine phosphatase family protein [Pseudosulfitobact
MIRLALLRHGHTAWNRAHRIQGRTDIPLDDQAVADLGALRLPPPWDRAQLWSSPLQRAAQTAELVAGRVPRTDPALMEMDWGDWEGQHGTELRADPASGFRDIEHWGWDYAPPGGESPAHLRARLVPWANALTRDSVAVCHIGVMRVLLAHATGWEFDGPAPFAVRRNRLFVINISDATWSFDGSPVRLEARP